MLTGKTTTAISILVATALVAGPEVAGASKGKKKRPPPGVVVACSTYGHGCYVAPTRRGKWGLEMRLKGGTWIDCEGDCRDTLRMKTVDFWDTLRETGGGDGGG